MKTTTYVKRAVLGIVLCLATLTSFETFANPIVEFPSLADGNHPSGIVTGPDGNIWFTEVEGTIGRMHPDGSLAEFLTSGAGLQQIVVGPDHNLWFVEVATHKIGRIKPDGTIKEFPTMCSPSGYIVSGPHNSIWFPEGCGSSSQISEMATLGAAAGTITSHVLPTGVTRILSSIALGADSNLWFVDYFRCSVTRFKVSTSEFTEFAIPGAPGTELGDLVLGPDDKIWIAFGETIARISVNGDVDEFDLPHYGDTLNLNTVAPDGSVWAIANAALRRIVATPSSVSSSRYAIDSAAFFAAMTPGPGGNLWFTEYNGDRIGKIVPDVVFFDGFGDNL